VSKLALGVAIVVLAFVRGEIPVINLAELEQAAVRALRRCVVTGRDARHVRRHCQGGSDLARLDSGKRLTHG